MRRTPHTDEWLKQGVGRDDPICRQKHLHDEFPIDEQDQECHPLNHGNACPKPNGYASGVPSIDERSHRQVEGIRDQNNERQPVGQIAYAANAMGDQCSPRHEKNVAEGNGREVWEAGDHRPLNPLPHGDGGVEDDFKTERPDVKPLVFPVESRREGV